VENSNSVPGIMTPIYLIWHIRLNIHQQTLQNI
jgi:hypothetical protein